MYIHYKMITITSLVTFCHPTKLIHITSKFTERLTKGSPQWAQIAVGLNTEIFEEVVIL